MAVVVLTTIKLVINAGWRFVYPFLPAIGRGLGVDLGQMGLLLSIRWGVGFAAPLGVAAVERSRSSRRLIAVGLVAFGVGAIVTAASGVLIGAVVGFAFMGIGKPLLDVGAATYVSERVPYRNRARSLGVLELSWAGGFLIGAPLAGWLIESWGWNVPFWVFGGIALLALGLIVAILAPHDHSQTDGSNQVDPSRATVGPFLFSVVIAGFTLELIFVVMGTWLEGSFGLSLFALAGVGALLGVAELGGEGLMVAFTDRIGKRNSFAVGLAATAVSLVALAFWSVNLVPALAALFLAILALELAVISGLPMASELRPARRARFLAWTLVAAGVGRLAADLVGPVVFQRWDMTGVASLAAASALAGVGVLVFAVDDIAVK